MPLLNMVGISSTYESFNAGFCFLASESEADYTWALKQLTKWWGRSPRVAATDGDAAFANAIRKVWPNCTHVLCIWHINKNVKKNTKPFFVRCSMLNGEEVGAGDHDEFMRDWYAAVGSLSLAEFEEKYAAMETKYVEGRQPLAMVYLKTYLCPKAEKFVRGRQQIILYPCPCPCLLPAPAFLPSSMPLPLPLSSCMPTRLPYMPPSLPPVQVW